MPSPSIHFLLPFSCTLAKQNLGFTATVTLGAPIYQVLLSSLIHEKKKVKLTFTWAKHRRVHTENMFNTCPIIPNASVSLLLSSTWKKRAYTKTLQNHQHAHHGNQWACMAAASLIELLRISSTFWFQVVLTALASTSLCMATVLIPIFLHVLMTYHVRSDNYQHLKYQ